MVSRYACHTFFTWYSWPFLRRFSFTFRREEDYNKKCSSPLPPACAARGRASSGSGTTANVKGRIIYVFHLQEPRHHPHQRQVLCAAGPQMPGTAGGGRDHRGPRHRPLSAESRPAQRLHRHLRRDRRRAADVQHRPRHQPAGADAGRPHRHPHRLRGRGGASGGRHPALQPLLRLFGGGQHRSSTVPSSSVPS